MHDSQLFVVLTTGDKFMFTSIWETHTLSFMSKTPPLSENREDAVFRRRSAKYLKYLEPAVRMKSLLVNPCTVTV